MATEAHDVVVPGSPEPGGGLPAGTPTLGKQVMWLIAIGAAIRFVLGAALGLGIDESYAVVSARQLNASYFDHPPLSFWLAHLSATLLGSESHLAVRLPFILLFALTTWLMYRLTARVFGEIAGWLAALFLNLSVVFSVSTGSWVLPDGPLMFGVVAAAYTLIGALFDPEDAGHHWRWWLAAGGATGVAMLSKYQAVLFPLGVLLFLAARPAQRHWLRRPEPYAAAALALALFAPVILWNARHAWVSFAFQLGRNAPPRSLTLARMAGSLGQNLAGQIGWVLPWIWLPLIVVLVRAFRSHPPNDRRWFFACLAVVPIALFTVASLGGQPGQPHWAAPGYLFLFPLLGAQTAALLHDGLDAIPLPARDNAGEPVLPIPHHVLHQGPRSYFYEAENRDVQRLRDRTLRWVTGSLAAMVLLLTLGGSAAVTGWPGRAFPALFRRGDPTLEALDWHELRPGLESLGVLERPHTFIAAPSWVQGGKAAYALGPGVPVVVLSVDPHQFAFLYDQRAFLSEDAIIVARLPTPQDIVVRYGPNFDKVTPIGRIAINRWGRPAFDVGVYRGHRFRRLVPPASLPAGALARTIPSPLDGEYLPPDSTHPLRREPAP